MPLISLAQRQHRVRREVLGANVCRHFVARVADHRARSHILIEHTRGLLRDRDEVRRLLRRDRMVQRVGGRHRADQDQHDQAHALLPVVGAVREADAGAGQNQQTANPERRWRVAFRRFVEPRIADEDFRQAQQRGSQREADDRRKQQRLADVQRLAPIDAAGRRSAPASTGSRCRRR